MFKGWVDDDDGFQNVDKGQKRKDPIIEYGVGLKNYF